MYIASLSHAAFDQIYSFNYYPNLCILITSKQTVVKIIPSFKRMNIFIKIKYRKY